MEMSFDAKSAIRVFASLAAIVCVVQLYRITPQSSVQIEGRGVAENAERREREPDVEKNGMEGRDEEVAEGAGGIYR